MRARPIPYTMRQIFSQVTCIKLKLGVVRLKRIGLQAITESNKGAKQMTLADTIKQIETRRSVTLAPVNTTNKDSHND